MVKCCRMEYVNAKCTFWVLEIELLIYDDKVGFSFLFTSIFLLLPPTPIETWSQSWNEKHLKTQWCWTANLNHFLLTIEILSPSIVFLVGLPLKSQFHWGVIYIKRIHWLCRNWWVLTSVLLCNCHNIDITIIEVS